MPAANTLAAVDVLQALARVAGVGPAFADAATVLSELAHSLWPQGIASVAADCNASFPDVGGAAATGVHGVWPRPEPAAHGVALQRCAAFTDTGACSRGWQCTAAHGERRRGPYCHSARPIYHHIENCSA